jgi:hypothetical protein
MIDYPRRSICISPEIVQLRLINRLRRIKCAGFYRNDLVVIHIGKCAGATVRKELNAAGMAHSEVHVSKPIYYPDKRYLILLRNPVDRFVSAFNWRSRIIAEGLYKKSRKGIEAEKRVFHRFLTAEQAALALFLSDGSPDFDVWRQLNCIGHVSMNIDFYLRSFLHLCDRKSLIGVVSVETLNSDMQRLFSVGVSSFEHRNSTPGLNTQLSGLARSYLVRYLHSDYKCIMRLADFGLIPEESLEKLMC